MNYISIDPSLTSTAVVINDRIFNYVSEDKACTKSGLSKWYKIFEELITYRFTNYNKSSNYSDEQISKLLDYNEVTDLIIDDIRENINQKDGCIIGIEGFSYSSNAGPLIDLVTYSTLLRIKLFEKISNNIKIYSPSTLKLNSCMMTYTHTTKGKKNPKIVCKNYEGMSGGSFKKREMYLSLIENENNQDPYVNLLREYKSDLDKMNIPKPIEDVNDAIIISKYLKLTYPS